MARLGELLTTARLVDPEQVERALRAQVVWGGRLGTNLVELGAVDLETLTRILGRQHGLPSAQARHFERADPELQKRLPVELARQYSIVPLLYIKKEDRYALATTGHLPAAAIAPITEAFACRPEQLLVAIAPELRIRYHLERVYKITRSTRFLRLRKSTITPFPQFDNIPVPIDSEGEVAVPIIIDDKQHPTGRAAVPGPPSIAIANVEDISALIEEAIEAVTAREPTEPVGRERRTYVRTLGEGVPVTGDATQPLPPMRDKAIARIALKRVGVVPLDNALRAIRGSGNRDRVADLAIDTLEKYVETCDAALLLVIRGDVAISWKSFSRGGAIAPELAVPLDQEGLVPSVIQRNDIARCGAGDLGPIDQLLLRSLGESDGDLVIVPIAIGDKVVAALAVATEANADVEGVAAVAGAAAAAFARLIRDASR